MALYHSWRQILLPPACVPRPGHALLADSSLSGETLALPGWTQSRLPVPAPSAQGLCCDCCCWGLGFLFVVETWQKSEEYAPLIELCPLDCNFISTLGPLDVVEASLWFSEAVLQVER
ncbi:hypothetical protein AAFF_G00315330 [Aldrovandia affinis]|uniref:Uncharacterized protein n=1 Tax=Aldrovandia affinis TaxID=143900 RepID=A0AAD7WQR8_9TELE|nr:hypothetical protein AAFF_G00315330 [Aldrovandia affinis]